MTFSLLHLGLFLVMLAASARALNSSLDGTWMNDMSYIMTQAGLVRMVGLNKNAVRACLCTCMSRCMCGLFYLFFLPRTPVREMGGGSVQIKHIHVNP